MLLAKTSDFGVVYALSLISDGSNYLLRLTYQQGVDGTSLGVATAEVSLLQSDLVDGTWHSLVVAVGQGTALFYRDSNFITSRSETTSGTENLTHFNLLTTNAIWSKKKLCV